MSQRTADITGVDVAIVTYDARPEPTDDDRLLVQALEARGARVDARSWSDPAARWSRYDAVVVRSCWDYFRRPAEFHAWLDRLEVERATVHNPVPTLRWNADKRYLRDLEARAVPVVPTHWVPLGAAPSIDGIRRRTGWKVLVVKPAVSGGAYGTWRSSPGAPSVSADDDARLAASAAEGDVMVQPMLEEIEREGEWSLHFFDGAFSHAIVKRPRTGDFRVQLEHGGSVESAEPSAAMIEAARRAIDAAPDTGAPPLYARVDGCVVNGAFVLMELELLEPALSLACSNGAAERLADALLRRIG
jgi:glutathione synthase/RimK-type ligase-like ATP-grasp enzyme